MCYGGSEQKPPLLYRSHVSSRAVSDTVSMATLGDIQLSLLSGQQQTSLSAAAFNFDFTLVKVAPPKEYEGLGKGLSVRILQIPVSISPSRATNFHAGLPSTVLSTNRPSSSKQLYVPLTGESGWRTLICIAHSGLHGVPVRF